MPAFPLPAPPMVQGRRVGCARHRRPGRWRASGSGSRLRRVSMRAFLFPGQGSQAVGMGGDLAAASAHARAVFEEVDEALGQKLSRLMVDGPADDLTLTENAQPAIMANA